MSDLEFQRELSPEQIREALLLLDSKAGAQNHSLRAEDLNSAEEIGPEPNESSTTTATPDCTPMAEQLHSGRRHLNSAAFFYGIGIVAAAALALLLWKESTLALPPLSEMRHAQLPNQQGATALEIASPTLPLANSVADHAGDGLGRRPSGREVAGLSDPAYLNPDNDQAAVPDAASRDSASPVTARSAAIPPIGTGQARWDERTSGKPEQAWSHAQTVRVSAAKKRLWRHHSQARAGGNGGGSCFPVCPPRRAQRVVYEPPRNIIQ
jgi:hypothetical protein